jgi:hypothetical protein
MSKGIWPLKEYTKLPLLHGCTLHLPALSGIGLATALAMLSLTSLTIASAARALMCCSTTLSVCPPERRTVTSVIVGSMVCPFDGAVPCRVFAAAAATPAYDAGVRLICWGWGGLVSIASPCCPFLFFLLRRLTGMNSWSSLCALSSALPEVTVSLTLLEPAAGCHVLVRLFSVLVAAPLLSRGLCWAWGGGIDTRSSASSRVMKGCMAA